MPQQIRRFWRHQALAWPHVRREQHPALLMEMRLGKTLLAIRGTLAYSKHGQRILCVMPYSAMQGWVDELRMEGQQNIVMITGTRKQRLARLASVRRYYGPGNRWCIINHEGHLSVGNALQAMRWDVVILDEATFIKSPRSRASRFFCQAFAQVPHRWILVGRPAAESEMDMFQLFKFLHGKMLGFTNYWRFQNSLYTHHEESHSWWARPGTKRSIAGYVAGRAVLMSRRDAGVEERKVYERRCVTMPPAMRKIYDIAEETFILENLIGEEIADTKSALTRMVWLRHLCNGFLDGKQINTAKEDEVIRLLTGELWGEKVVIWFAYNEGIAPLRRRLGRLGLPYAWITGKTRKRVRQGLQADFQSPSDGSPDVLLMQVACGKFGLDLSVADTAIYFDRPLSCLARLQSEDRIVHLRKRVPLLYVDIVMKNSVDEYILKLLQRKRQGQVRLLDLVREIQIERGRHHVRED